MDEVNHKDNEIACQLTNRQVKSILSWFRYFYSYNTMDDNSKRTANFLIKCIDEN